MAHSVSDIGTFGFSGDDHLLVDANIWLLVYGPQKPGDKRVASYSGAFSRMLAAGCRIYTDVLIVSEFINAYARLKWKLVAPHLGDFKLFRKSDDFKPVAQEISDNVKRVLKHCIRLSNGFDSLEIDTLLGTYALGDSDFNDQILVSQCQKNGLVLVTDDADFKGQPVSVITANKRLIV